MTIETFFGLPHKESDEHKLDVIHKILADTLPYLRWQNEVIIDLLGVIITDQDHLNTDVAALTAAFATIIDALKATPAATPLDFTAADALVASVQAAAPVVVTDPTTPVTDPSAPVVDPSAPVTDTSVATA